MRLMTILKHGTKVYYDMDYSEYIVKPYKSKEPDWLYYDATRLIDAMDKAKAIEQGIN